MPDFDLQLRTGMVVDAARTPRWVGDVEIRDGRIAQLGGTPGAAERVIDATGCECTGAPPGRLLRHGWADC